jgi:hypothetical protein
MPEVYPHRLTKDAGWAQSVHQPIHATRPAIPLGDVAPGRTGAEAPEDAVEHTAIIHSRHAARLVGQQRLDDLPLEIGQLMATH